jgi:hypothetical protein
MTNVISAALRGTFLQLPPAACADGFYSVAGPDEFAPSHRLVIPGVIGPL